MTPINRRPRGFCPVCGRDVALKPAARTVGVHHDDETALRCTGIGLLPVDVPSVADLLARLQELVACNEAIAGNLEAYIQHRAEEISGVRFFRDEPL